MTKILQLFFPTGLTIGPDDIQTVLAYQARIGRRCDPIVESQSGRAIQMALISSEHGKRFQSDGRTIRQV